MFGFDAHLLVERHFAGDVGPWSERRMWRHLRTCDRCRSRYRTRSLLETMEAGGEDLARMRLGRGLFARRRPLLPALALTGTLVAGTAAVALMPRAARYLPDFSTTSDDGAFRARSGGGEATPGPALSVFRIDDDGPTRAGAVIHAGDALGFAYRNPAAASHRFLMIFARDQRGRTFWYWPAWTDPAQAPTALPIAPAADPVELREGVRHPLAPGGLTLYGLFVDQPLDVKAVEAAAHAGADDGLRALAARNAGALVQERVEVLP
jgi:hypothetical protein